MDSCDQPSLLAHHQVGEFITPDALKEIVEQIAEEWVLKPGVKRLLLIPPDQTRIASQAGQITALLWSMLSDRVSIDVLPAVGTHHTMKTRQLRRMFGDEIPREKFLDHVWRQDLKPSLGNIPANRVEELTSGHLHEPIEVAINQRIVSGQYDLVLSIGQVVPHEVVGYANHSKNICIGCGGGKTLQLSHYLGALCGIERVMGVADTPVRRLLDEAFYRYVRPRADVRFVLTVVEDTTSGPRLAAVTAGEGKACFEWAAEISSERNITVVERPLQRALVWLDPEEFTSTWVGNKAVYRLRKAMEAGGEILILAPGVCSFGEDEKIDMLIRRYGYRGLEHTQDAITRDEELRSNLSAAAHLIHGSSEGRFDITYCAGRGLSPEQIRGVGYHSRDFQQAVHDFGITPQTANGWRQDADGRDFYFVRNPALGLWTS